MQSQKQYRPKFSFECYSPKTPDSIASLQSTQLELAELNPDFFSVTYGAGGSTRNMTFETVMDIRNKTGIECVPHISCVGNWDNDIRSMLQKYIDHDITRIVVLRGDLPSGTVGYGQFQHANELVEFIRKETLTIDKGIALTSTSEFFDDLSKGNGPKNSILALGYAGWGPGQIESELISNSWMTLRTDSNFIFDESVSNKWNDAYDMLGVDPNKLSQFSGSS